MAYEIPGFSFSLIAGQDLSTSLFCGVDVSSAGKAALPVQGKRCIGILQNKPASGEVATIVTTGVSKVKIGITGLVAGNNVTVDDDGTIIQSTNLDRAIGVALKSGNAGEIGTVLLMNGQAVVAGS